MDGNGRRYSGWWSRRGLLLAGTAVLVFGLGLGLRWALRHIDDDLNLIIRRLLLQDRGAGPRDSAVCVG